MNMERKQQFILCDCGHPEHQFIMTYWTDDEDKELMIDIHLTKKSLLERINYALRYIFGYQSRYGAFDEIVINRETALVMTGFLLEFTENKLAWPSRTFTTGDGGSIISEQSTSTVAE